MGRAIGTTLVALAVLTALVLAGVLTGVDEWGLDHVMPGLDPRARGNGIVTTHGLWRPFPLHIPWWEQGLDLYTYPGSALVSGLLMAIVCVVLVRRGRLWPALVWLGAWLAGSGIELAGKQFLTRPSLYWTDGHARIHVVPFANSYPSGHTIRSVVIAAMIAFVWRRARLPAAIWAAFVPVCLVLVAAHTITDVIGGLLLGALIVLLAPASTHEWPPPRIFSVSPSEATSGTRKPFWPTSQAKRSSSPPTS